MRLKNSFVNVSEYEKSLLHLFRQTNEMTTTKTLSTPKDPAGLIPVREFLKANGINAVCEHTLGEGVTNVLVTEYGLGLRELEQRIKDLLPSMDVQRVQSTIYINFKKAAK